MDTTNVVLTLIFSGVVAVATAIIAQATKKYVELNAALVEETRLLRKVQSDPRVSVFMQQQDPTNVLVDLIVKNDSQAQALDLEFSIFPDVYYFQNQKLSEVGFLQYLPSLQPGESRTLPILTRYFRRVDGKGESVPEILDITVRYKDVADNRRQCQFHIPLKTYTHGETWSGDSALDKIAKSLENIEKTTHLLSKHFKER